MSHQLTLSQFEYRASLALNNMAVAMMGRSCYQQALETLKSALILMKLAAADAVMPRCEHEYQLVLKKLHQADQRAAVPKQSSIWLPTKVVSHDEVFCSADGRAAYFLLRIEAYGDGFCDSHDDVLHTAIILFNLAVAFLCQSKCEVHLWEQQASTARYNAKTLLEYTQSLLEAIIKESVAVDDAPRAMRVSCSPDAEMIAGVYALTLQALARTSEEDGNYRSAMSYARARARLCSSTTRRRLPIIRQAPAA